MLVVLLLDLFTYCASSLQLKQKLSLSSVEMWWPSQARATFFGRGPHQYFDRMSGATPESFTTYDYHML